MLLLNAGGVTRPVTSLAFGRGGFSLYWASGPDLVRADLRADDAFPLDSDQGEWFFSVSVAPDGQHVVGCGNHLCVWDTTDHALEASTPCLWGTRIAFSPDGRTLYGVGFARFLRWRTDTWEPMKPPPGLRNLFNGVGPAVSAAGLVAAFYRLTAAEPVGTGSTAIIRDAATGKFRRRLDSPNLDVTAIALSPDGTLAVTANGAILRGWGIGSGALRWKVKPANHFVTDLAFTADGRHVLTAGNDRTVRQLRAADGTQAAAYTWDVGKVTALAVSADGTRAAAGGDAGGVVVWDLDA